MSSEDHDVVIPIPDGSSHAHPDLSAHYAHHQPGRDSHDDLRQCDDEPPPFLLEVTARADLPQQLLVSPTPRRASDRQGRQHRTVAEPSHAVTSASNDTMTDSHPHPQPLVQHMQQMPPQRGSTLPYAAPAPRHTLGDSLTSGVNTASNDTLMTAAVNDASDSHPHPQPLMRHMQQMPPQRGSTLPYAAPAPHHTFGDSLTSPGEASSGVNTALPLNSVADQALPLADAASYVVADGRATAATAFHPPARHHSGGIEVDGGIGGRDDVGGIRDGRSRSNDEMSEVVDGSFCMPPSPSILPTKAPDGRSDSARLAAFANAADTQSVRSNSAVSSRQSPGPNSSRQSPVSQFRQSHRNATPDPFGHLHDSQSSLRSPQFGSTLHLPRYRQHPQQHATPTASSGFPSALNLRQPPGASAPSRRSFIRQDSGDPLNRRVSGEAVESTIGGLDDDDETHDDTKSDARSITPANSTQHGAKPSLRSGDGDRRGTSGGLDAKSRQEKDKEREKEKEKKKELFSHFGSSADFMRSLGMKETTIERAVSSVSSRRTSPRFGESTHSTGSSPKAVDRRTNSSSDSPKANNQPPRPLNTQPQQRDRPSTQQHEVKIHHRSSEDGRATQRDSNGDTVEDGKQRSTNPGAATQQGQKKRSQMQELLFMHEEKLRLEALGKAPPVPPFGSVPPELTTLDPRRKSPARSPVLTTSGMHHPPKTTTVVTAAASTPATPKSPISASSPFLSNTLLVGASSTSGASSKFAAKHDGDDRGDRNTVTTTGTRVGVPSSLSAPRPTSPTGSPRRPTPTSLQDGFGRTPFEAFRMQLVRLCKDHNVDLLRDAGMRDYSSVKVLPPSPRPQQHGPGSTLATDPNAMSAKIEKKSTEAEPTPAKSDAASPLSPLSAALRNISSAGDASGKRPRRSFSASASVSATGGVSTGMARTSSFIQRPKDRKFWSASPEEMDPAEAAAAAVVARRRGRQHSITSPTSRSTKTFGSAGGATDGPDDFSMSMSGRGGRRKSLTTPLSPASPSGVRFVPTRSLAQLRTDGTLILQHHARPTSPMPKATFESALSGGVNNEGGDDGEAAMSATFRGELELFQKGMLTTLRQRPSTTDSSPPRGAHDDSDAEGNGDGDDDADARRRSSTHGAAGQDHKSWWRSDDKRPTGYTHSKRAASTAAKDTHRSAVVRDPSLAQFARLAKMSESPFSQDAASSAFDSSRQESSSLRPQAPLQYGRKSAVTVVSPRRDEANIRGMVDPGVFSPRKSTNTKGRGETDDTDYTSSTATSTRSSFSGVDSGDCVSAGGGGDSTALTSPSNRFTNLSAGQSQPGFLRLDGRSDDPSVVDNERHRHRRDADKDTSRPASTDGGPQHPTPSTAKESRSSSTKRSARVTMTDCHEGRDRTPGGGRSDRGSHEPSRGERHHGVPDRSLLSEEEKEREEVRAWFVDEYHRRVDPTTEVPVLYAGSHSHPGSRAVAQPIQPSDLDDIYSSVGLHRQNASRNGAVLMSPAIKATTATVGGRSTTPRSVTAKLTSAGVRTSPSTGTARHPRTEGDTRATPTARVRHHKRGSSTSTTDGGTFSSSDDDNENEGRCGTTMSELELTRSGDTDGDQSTDALELYERQLNERAVISETLTAREKDMIRSQLAAPAERRNASTRSMYTKVTELPMPPTPPELLVGTHQGRRDAERAAELEERAAVTQLCSLKETARRTGVLKTFAGGGFSAVGDSTSRYNASSAAVVYNTNRGAVHGPSDTRGNDGGQHTSPGAGAGRRGSAAAEADVTAARSALHKRTSLDAEVAALSRRQLRAHAAGSSSSAHVKEERSDFKKTNDGSAAVVADRDPASIGQHQGAQLLHTDMSSGAFAPSSPGTIGGRDQQRSALTSPSRHIASPTATATNGARRVSANGAQYRTGGTPLDNDTFDTPPASRVRRVSLGGELASPTATTDSPEDRSSGRRSPTSAAASAASFARLIAGETAATKHDGGASHPTRGNGTSGAAKKQDAATKLKAYTAFSEEVLETEDDGVDSLASPPQVDLALPTPAGAARNGHAAKGASRGGAGTGQHPYQTSQAHSRRTPTQAESFLANGFAGATSHQEFFDGDTTFEFDTFGATGRPETAKESSRHMFNFNAAPRSQVIAAQCKRLAMKTFEAPPAQMTAYAVGDPMRTRGRERLGPARLSSKTAVQESLDHRKARRRGCCSKSPPPNAPRGPEWAKPGQSIIAGTFTIDESSYPYPDDDNDDDAASLGGHQNSGLGNQRSSLVGGGARGGRAQTLGQIPSLSGLTDSSRRAGSMQRLPRRNSPPSPNSRASPSSHDEDAHTNDTPLDDDGGDQDGRRSRDDDDGTSRRNSPVSASAVASRTQSRMKPASSSRSLGGDLGSGEGSKVTLRTTASMRTANDNNDGTDVDDNDQDRGDGARSPGSLAVEESDRWSTASPSGVVRSRSRGVAGRGGGGLAAAKSRTSVTIDDRGVRQQGGDAPSPRSGATSRAHSFFSQNAGSAVSNDDRDEPHQAMQPSARTDRSRAASVQQQPDRDRTPRQNESESDIFGQHLDLGGDNDDDDEDDNDHASQRAEVGRSFRMALRDPAARHDPRDSRDVRPDAILGRTESTLTRMSARSGTSTRTGYLAGLASRRSSRAGGGLTPRRSPPPSGPTIPSTPALYSQRKRRDGGRGASGAAEDHSGSPSLSPQPSRRALRNNDVDDAADEGGPRREGSMSPSPTPASRGLNTPSSPRDAESPGFGREATEPPFDDQAHQLLDDVSMPMSPTQRTPRGAVASPRDMSPRRRATLEPQPSSRFVDPALDRRGPTSAPTTPRGGDTAARRLPPRRQPPASRQ